MKDKTRAQLLDSDWGRAKDRLNWEAKRAFIILSIGWGYHYQSIEREHKRLQLI